MAAAVTWLRGYVYAQVFLGWNHVRAKLYADLCRRGFTQSVHGFNGPL